MVDKIIKVISETLETSINATTSQDNCDKWDSLRHLNIVIALEEAFAVSFEPEDIAKMKCIKDIGKILNNYLNNN